MTAKRTDLLSVTRALLTLWFWVTVLCLPAAFILLATGHEQSVSFGDTAALTADQRLLAARVHWASLLVVTALIIPVVLQMRAIVDSARSADPFVPENGLRLRRIGWLILAGNAVMFVASFAQPPNLHDQSGSYPGLFTVLLIFVLARIFETGTRMRTEIQETV
jgi:hypothetical protein